MYIERHEAEVEAKLGLLCRLWSQWTTVEDVIIVYSLKKIYIPQQKEDNTCSSETVGSGGLDLLKMILRIVLCMP